VKALDKYEPEKGFKFSTYAAWWVKMACTRCIAEKSRVVRLPIHVHDLLLTLERVYEELSNKYCRSPTSKCVFVCLFFFLVLEKKSNLLFRVS